MPAVLREQGRRASSSRLLNRTGRFGTRQEIAEGIALISEALPKGSVGPYQLQAAIAALHDEAARVEETDWPQILALYDLLKRMSDNPMVEFEPRHRGRNGSWRGGGTEAHGRSRS